MRTDAPLSTYRLQLGGDVGFSAAAGLLDYLDDLGVTHLYLSPVLTARAGSTHGYDVADPERVAEALGGEEGLRSLAAAAHARGMGLVVDLVPNHVGTGADNPLWQALLTGGRSGEAGETFDVDWAPPLPGVSDKVVLPVLGAPYGEVLAAGELRVEDSEGTPRVRYQEHSFPLSERSVDALARSGTARLNGEAGNTGSWGQLHGLLEEQHYRLVHWEVGDALVNYRRFFAVTDLAAVRVELSSVFNLVHATLVRLVHEGVLDGLRVDHVDGLADPTGYALRLVEATGGVWTVVEKVLAPGEAMPDWPVAGGTGYDFLADTLGLFVDPAAEQVLTDLASDFGAWPADVHAATREAKAEMLDTLLTADCDRLARLVWALTESDLRARDTDLRTCRQAVVALISGLDVYRTYTVPGEAARPEDRERLESALETAIGVAPELPEALWQLLRRVLLGEGTPGIAHDEVLRRFQQLSGAVMAKGVEDTMLYRQHRLLAVNDVGVEPEPLGVSVADFHVRNAERARRHPAGMLTTSTHDTKRGEDTRLRIAALSELTPEWSQVAWGWRERNQRLLADTLSGPAPDPATEYLLYQTLVGVWPPAGGRERLGELEERVQAYLVKATREAGMRTTWRRPDKAFEDGVAGFVRALLSDGGFVGELETFGKRVNEIAMVASLAQTLLRCTSPGVPDVYQGQELWGDDLVDPDNRRPVDFAARAEALAGLDGADPAALLAVREDGRVKLWVLSRALRARRAHREAFGSQGAYTPLTVSGRWADHVVAFARNAVVTLAPRLPGAIMAGRDRPPLGEDWEDTGVTLPAEGKWADALGGPGCDSGEARLAEVCATLPVALLTNACSETTS